MEPITYIWQDKKRILGQPMSFTKYSLSEDRLFIERGLLNLKQDEILLYRVRDLELTISLGQRMFGVGTVCVKSSDQSLPVLELKNVKDPRNVKEMIHQAVEASKSSHGVHSMEVVGGSEHACDHHEAI